MTRKKRLELSDQVMVMRNARIEPAAKPPTVYDHPRARAENSSSLAALGLFLGRVAGFL